MKIREPVGTGTYQLYPKMLLDMVGKRVVYFFVPWHGLLGPGYWVLIKIMIPTMTKQHTAVLGQISNKLFPLHNEISLTW